MDLTVLGSNLAYAECDDGVDLYRRTRELGEDLGWEFDTHLDDAEVAILADEFG